MTTIRQATAQAHPNIAFIKYWGNRDDALNLPENSTLSMNLDGLYARTTVTWADDQSDDRFILNDNDQSGEGLRRVSAHLEILRQRLAISSHAEVKSSNNFPIGAGIASSAAAFAALTVAGVSAAGGTLNERELTTLARIGSGSASRSVPTGFVEWHKGETHENSFAASIAPPSHWDLVDVIAVVSKAHKNVGSKVGHRSARTSDLQQARVDGAESRFNQCKSAILARDFSSFADVVEEDSNLMHAVMMTSRPPLFYWLPPTLSIMESVRNWRVDGVQVCYTLDAGPNVHCICVREAVDFVSQQLNGMSEVLDVRVANVGQGAVII